MPFIYFVATSLPATYVGEYKVRLDIIFFKTSAQVGFVTCFLPFSHLAFFFVFSLSASCHSTKERLDFFFKNKSMIISYAPPHMLYMMIWYPEGKKEKKKKSELGVPGDTSRMHREFVTHTRSSVQSAYYSECAKKL